MDYTVNPRRRFDILKDPVHGYICFTRYKLRPEEKATEADLINSEWMQRLRKIRQLQTAWYVYPAADHTRFAHALGVMELAGRFARTVYEPFYKQLFAVGYVIMGREPVYNGFVIVFYGTVLLFVFSFFTERVRVFRTISF